MKLLVSKIIHIPDQINDIHIKAYFYSVLFSVNHLISETHTTDMTNITFQLTVVMNSTFPSAEGLSSKLGVISSIIGSEILQQEPTSSPAY